MSILDFPLFVFHFTKMSLTIGTFFNNNNVFWLMNIYSDSLHSALKYLKNTEVCIQNLLIMTGDFNIHDSL